MKDDKRADIAKLMSDINRTAGKKLQGEDRKIMFGSDFPAVEKVRTGYVAYDYIVGGEPKGRWTIDYGIESSGKSSFNYWKIGVLQRKGMTCAVVNMEDSFDADWASHLGVGLDDLVMIPVQEHFEATLDKFREIVAARLIDFFLIDSIHGVGTQADLFKKGSGSTPTKTRSLADDTVAALPKKIGQFIRTVTPVLGKSKAIITLIGQAREKVDSFSGGGLQLTGGHALKHAVSCIRLWTRAPKATWPKQTVDGQPVDIGFIANVKIQKTKLNGNEGKSIFIPFLYSIGPSIERSNVDMGILCGAIESPSAAWFQWSGGAEPKKLNGRQAVYSFFDENPDEHAKLVEQLEKRYLTEEK